MTEPNVSHPEVKGDSGAYATRSVAGLISLFFSTQFLKFLLVGGLAAFLHWYARYLLTPLMGYVWALCLAYAIGISVGYVLNAVFVFSKAQNARSKQIGYFVLFNLLMAPVVIVLSYLLSEVVFASVGMSYHPREIAHGIGVASPVFINFLLHKFLTFKGA